MVVIRLARAGKRKNPFYHLSVTDKRNPRDGRFIERVGYYNPIARGEAVRTWVNLERVDYWISVGAVPSPKVKSIIKNARDEQAIAAQAEEVAEAAPVDQSSDNDEVAEEVSEDSPVALADESVEDAAEQVEGDASEASAQQEVEDPSEESSEASAQQEVEDTSAESSEASAEEESASESEATPKESSDEAEESEDSSGDDSKEDSS